MRLHRLAVTGFGPFRDEQVVDFETLSANGLFLLTGDTGAGKSSVLDAVAYALYGRVAGAWASATRIRSDHADPDRPTMVVLELTLRGKRMRVTRAPEWHRRKVRGTGTTKQPTTVRLERLVDGAWELGSNRADEVGQELIDLLGMNHQQFCQVVLLPQGDFAQFLRADAETRKRLLERLFGTERFSNVEGWLVERRRERGQELSTVDREIEATIARLAEVTDDPAPPPADEAVGVTAWANGQVSMVEALLAEASAALATARSERSTADRRLEFERSLADRQERVRSLNARAASLVAAAPRVELARLELVAARRVAALGTLLDAATTGTERAARARADALVGLQQVRQHTAGTAASAAVAGLDDSSSPTAQTAAVLEGAEHTLRAEITRLETLLGDEKRLLELTAEQRQAEDDVADLQADVAEHRGWLEGMAVRSAALHKRRDELVEIVRDQAAQRDEHEALGASIEAARARESLAAELEIAGLRRRGAVDIAQRARQTWQDLREVRLAAMAAELAAALTTGSPCPVCGAIEHPAPAASAATALADASREDDALAEFERAERARELCADHYDEITAALQAATVAAGGADLPTVLTDRRELLSRRLAAAVAGTIELTAVQLQQQTLLAEADKRRDALTTAAAEHSRTAQLLAGLRTSAAALHIAIDAARGDDSTVAARIARLSAAVRELVTTREKVHQAVAADADVDAKIRGAERAAADAGFADLDAAADARRDDDAISALADQVQQHDHESVLVANATDDPEHAGTRLEPPADPAAAEHAVIEAAAHAERASARVGRLEASATSAARLAVQLTEQLSARGPLQQAYETVDGLSRLADGTNVENRLRMRLSYFVLSARLEQVADAASVRLLRMTDGRFSLVHSDDRAVGNQRSGLGLAVRDAWYDTTRDPATLSGGESFMASLALALGLADVVVAEAGGAFMDTLFVDEGFGSLDEATLDAVLDVLDGLREGGRAVGLVSHVGELRQRVPTQLTVCRGRSGSTLSLTA